MKNAETTFKNTQVAANEQIASAQSSVDSAQIALDNATQTLRDQERENEEDLDDAYEDALDTLRDSNTKADTALKQINYIQEKYFFTQDQEGNYIQSSEAALNETMDDLESDIDEINSSDRESIDSVLLEMSSFLADLADLLTYIRNELEDRTGLAATLVTDKGYIDTQRAGVDTAISNITAANQTIASTKLTNETSLNTDQASVDAAQAALAVAQTAYSATKADRDSRVEDAAGALELAKNQLAFKVAAPSKEELAIYEAQLAQAVAYADYIQRNLTDSVLVAPVDGFVTKIHAEIGELASLTQPAVSLVGRARYQVEAYISELDIAYVEADDPVEIVFDAFGTDRIFTGKVVQIDPFETLIDSDVYYKVTIAFEDYDPGIRLGMTADIQIKTAEKENVLVVPSRYIGEEDDKKYVKVWLNGLFSVAGEKQKGVGE